MPRYHPQKKYIHINPPIARFIEILNCAKPLERVFTNQSIGADESYWDFGDGTTSSDLNPVHLYSAPGTYKVSLRVVNHLSGCEFTLLKTIQVVDEEAIFFASDTVICKGTSIQIRGNLDTTSIRAFNWNFGDGISTTSALNSTNHLYTKAGNYTVRLIITDILGCKDSLIKNAYIRVNGPTAAFSTSTNCLNTPITFTDASKNDSQPPKYCTCSICPSGQSKVAELA